MQNNHFQAPKRPDRHMVAPQIIRPSTQNERPLGFTRRELRRLVADMIG